MRDVAHAWAARDKRLTRIEPERYQQEIEAASLRYDRELARSGIIAKQLVSDWHIDVRPAPSVVGVYMIPRGSDLHILQRIRYGQQEAGPIPGFGFLVVGVCTALIAIGIRFL